MHIVVMCPAVRGAMSYHLHALAHHYPAPEQMTLYVPDLFDGEALPCMVVKYPLSRRSGGKLAAYFSTLWARRRFQEIRALKPDILHLFNSDGYPCSWLWARWTRRELQKPFIVSVHDPEPHPGTLIGTVTYQVGKRTWKQASHVHIFSECFVPRMRRFGIRESRLFVIPLCTDVTNFTRHSQPNVTREPLALFFGRLEAYKGIPVLVEAAEQLRGKLRFAIAGPGKLPPRLHHRIVSQPDLFELHNRFLPEAEVARLFQRASVCVMPYVQATQSSVPWIAAAFGVPVVATATGGLADQIRQMRGVLVPPNNPEALAQGILQAYGQEATLPNAWNPKIVAEGYQAMYQRVYSEECCK
ncbi:MAG: glycosyltransferase family 4 protein [Fimbriimonadales bacterium]|nr:glycosyltransferase family 4 protein [Fimbriimonadales bacterium]